MKENVLILIGVIFIGIILINFLIKHIKKQKSNYKDINLKKNKIERPFIEKEKAKFQLWAILVFLVLLIFYIAIILLF